MLESGPARNRDQVGKKTGNPRNEAWWCFSRGLSYELSWVNPQFNPRVNPRLRHQEEKHAPARDVCQDRGGVGMTRRLDGTCTDSCLGLSAIKKMRRCTYSCLGLRVNQKQRSRTDSVLGLRATRKKRKCTDSCLGLMATKTRRSCTHF